MCVMHLPTTALHVETSIVVRHLDLVRMALTATNATLRFAFHGIQYVSVKCLARQRVDNAR